MKTDLIDQFEEIFRFGVESGKAEQRDEAEDFVALMLALAEQRTLPIYVVLTMRSDFIGDCDNFYGLPEAMNRSQYLVPRLTRPQRQQAIEGPTRLFGAKISPRLLDRVLNDVGDKSDQLPVMQHALMRTWEEWEKERQRNGETRGHGDAENPQPAIRNPQSVDVRHYEAVGTLTEALSRDAEAASKGLSEENQKIAERMLQALADTDARNRQIRRPAHLSELCAITGAGRATLEAIIEEFSGSGRSFLLQTNEADPLIDISHESLIRKWNRMTDWVNTEADWRDRYKRLSHDAEIHRQSDKPEDLLKGSQLASALEWQEKRNPNHAWARRYFPDLEAEAADQRFDTAISFLVESRDEREREIQRRKQEEQEKEDRRRQELRRTQKFAGILSLLLIAASLLAWGAWVQRRNAVAESQRAKEQEDKARLAEIQAQKERSIAIDERDLAKKARGEAERQKAIADAQTLAAQMAQKLADEQRGVAINQKELSDAFFFDASMNLAQSAFESDKRSRGYELLNQFLYPTFNKARNFYWYYLWRENHQEINTLKGHEDSVLSVAFSPDGKILASASGYGGGFQPDLPVGRDNTIKLWDARSGQLLNTLTGHKDSVRSVTFAPTGWTLASASDDKTVKLWDVRSGQLLNTFKGYEDSIYSVAFSPDGNRLALAFRPDGKGLFSNGDGVTVKLLDVRSGQLLSTLKLGIDVYQVALSPDGKTIASSGFGFSDSGNTIKLWDITLGQSIAILGEHENIISMAFSPNGKTLASASNDGSVRLCDVASRKIIAIIEGHQFPVDSIAFSPDGKILASASNNKFGNDAFGSDRTIKLWNIPSGQNIATLKGTKPI